MAIRKTTHILKNTQTNNKPLPTSGIEMGEPLVNLFNGILYFSGTSGGSFTPSDNNSTYFEVGSNVNNLVVRNQITSYSGVTNLTGKFLSGSSNGFVLADISSIAGIDSYVTGATWSPNTLTISLNNGKPNVPVTLSAFTGIDLYGNNVVKGNLNVTGTTTLESLSYYNPTVSGTNPLELTNVGYLTGYVNTNEIYVTGGTVSVPATDNTNSATIGLYYKNLLTPHTLPFQNTYTSGGTYNSGTTSIDFKRNDGVTYSVSLSNLDINDTYVTGFTYNSTNNSLTISRNQGEPDLTQYITSFSGISIGNLTPGQVVYAGTSGQLKTDGTGEFAYNDSTNTLTIGTTSGKLVVNNGLLDGPSTFGQGGLVVGSNGSITSPGVGDLTVHGNFIVFGTGTTVATNELYIEDPQITLNYNPTGDTSITSVSSGIRIQNGAGLLSGVTSGDTYFTIAQLSTLTGLTGTQVPDVSEYTGTSGYNNRGWLTQLNDIVIRNTNFNNGAPNGVRVLAEFDTLDGGQW